MQRRANPLVFFEMLDERKIRALVTALKKTSSKFPAGWWA